MNTHHLAMKPTASSHMTLILLFVGAAPLMASPDTTLPRGNPNNQTYFVNQSGTAPILIENMEFNITDLSNVSPVIWVNTTQEVTFKNCYFRGQGHLIYSDKAGARIKVLNSKGLGRFSNVAGREQGRFLLARSAGGTTLGPASLKVDHCTITGTTGVQGWSYSGNTTSDTFEFTNNKITNIDGRYSNGAGAPINDGTHFKTGALGFYLSKNLPYSKINSNEIILTRGQSATVDVITLYLSGGKSTTNPVQVNANYIQGNYPPPNGTNNPSQINLGDGNPALFGGYNPTNIQARWNSIVSGNGPGIAISRASNVLVDTNRIFKSGYEWNSNVRNPNSGTGLMTFNSGAKLVSYGYSQMGPMTGLTFSNNDSRSVVVGFDGTSIYKRFDIYVDLENSDTATFINNNWNYSTNTPRLPNATYHTFPSGATFWRSSAGSTGTPPGYLGYFHYFTEDTSIANVTMALEMREHDWWKTNVLNINAGNTVGCDW